MLPALQPCHQPCMPAASALRYLEASGLLITEIFCSIWLAKIQMHVFAQIRLRTTVACKRSNEVRAASRSQDPALAYQCTLGSCAFLTVRSVSKTQTY